MFNFNGNTPKKILFNGLNVAKLIYNGVVVWLAKVLTIITGYPITLTNSTGEDLVDYKIYGNSVLKVTNLFDGTYKGGYIASNKITAFRDAPTTHYLAVIPCNPNTTYVVEKEYATERFVVGFTDEYPYTGLAVTDSVNDYTAQKIISTSGATSQYLVAFVYNTNLDTLPLPNLKVYEAQSPDNPIEIQSVGDKTANLYAGQSEYTLTKVTNDTHISFYEAFEIGKTYTLFCYIDNTQGTATSGFRMSVGKVTDGVNSWYYLSSNRINVGSEGYVRALIPIPDNYNGQLNMQYQVNGGTVIFKDIMLVEGSYTLDNLPLYEPYGYKIPVNINQGNLYDKNTIKKGFVPISGIYPTQNSTYPNAQYQTIKLDSGKTYYFTTSVKANGRIRYADPLTPNISINLIQSSTLNNEYFTTDKVQDNQFNDATFTIKKDVILIIAGLKGLSSYTDLSFKEEPVITNIYLNEPLRKVGEYADYIDFENQKVVRNIKEAQINNSSSLNKFGGVKDYSVFFIIKNDLLDYGEEYKYNPPVLSNTFEFHPCGIANSNNSWTRNYQISASVTVNYKRMCFTLPNTITDVASAKEWLTENPIDYFYITSEPDDTETIELPNIPTHKGTTVIDIDTDILPSNMEVKYYGKE